MFALFRSNRFALVISLLTVIAAGCTYSEDTDSAPKSHPQKDAQTDTDQPENGDDSDAQQPGDTESPTPDDVAQGDDASNRDTDDETADEDASEPSDDTDESVDCADGQTQCDSSCVDTETNTSHCGSCGNTCSDGYICSRGICAPNELVATAVAETNNIRSSSQTCGETEQPAVDPVELNPELYEAAKAHADDMSENNFVGHEGSDGSDFKERVNRTDYTGTPLSENVTADDGTAEDVIQRWLKNEESCKHTMSPDADEVGIAATEGGILGKSWVQVFGTE